VEKNQGCDKYPPPLFRKEAGKQNVIKEQAFQSPFHAG